MSNKLTNNEVISIMIIILITIKGWNMDNNGKIGPNYHLYPDIYSMTRLKSIGYGPEECRDYELEYGEALSVPSEWELDDDVMTESLSPQSSTHHNEDDIEYISLDEYDNDRAIQDVEVNIDDIYRSWIEYDDDNDDGYDAEYDDVYNPLLRQQSNNNDNFEYPPWDEYDQFDDEQDMEQNDAINVDSMLSQQQNNNIDEGEFEYPPWSEHDDGDRESMEDIELNGIYQHEVININLIYADHGLFEYPLWSEYNDDVDDEDNNNINDYEHFEHQHEAMQDAELNDVYQQQEAININSIYTDDGEFEYPPWSEYDDDQND